MSEAEVAAGRDADIDDVQEGVGAHALEIPASMTSDQHREVDSSSAKLVFYFSQRGKTCNMPRKVQNEQSEQKGYKRRWSKRRL